jgi:Spy/CpxP family protein refolding chaperone
VVTKVYRSRRFSMTTFMKLMACVALSLVAGLAFSQPAPPVPGVPPGPVRALKALGLTDDQVTQVTDLVDKTRVAAKAQRASLGVIVAQIRQAMAAPTVDLKAVNALVDQKAALGAVLEKARWAEEVQLRQIVGDKAIDQVRLALRGHVGRGLPGGKAHRFKG